MLVLYLLVLLCQTIVADLQRIVFAMDRRDRLNPSGNLKTTHRLFDVRLIDSPEEFSAEFDVLVFANWTRLHDMYQQSTVKVAGYVDNDVSVMEMFDDKARWKAWMTEIGLHDYIPRTYNSTATVDDSEFPIMLKTNEHFGHGVHVIPDRQQLVAVAANMTSQGKSFTLEEALTGMALTEFAAFGSVHRGKLLSLRCNSRSFKEGAAKNSVDSINPSVGNTTAASPQIYVRGFRLKSSEEHNIPCSKEIVQALTTMFAETATYTGPFCTNFKLENSMRPKMMEINARYCGSLYANDFLFVTTFVPLAFAIHNETRKIPNFRTSAFENSNSTNKDELHHILDVEQQALSTGGGIYQGRWHTVDVFDPLKRLDSGSSAGTSKRKHRHSHDHNSSDHTTTKAARTKIHKIVFGVDHSEGLNPSDKLHSSASLFSFRILNTPQDLTPAIDIITHANHTALTALVQQANTTLPGYIANDQSSIDLFNDKGRWKAWMQDIGLGAYVPHTYNQSADILSYDYPLMLKTNQHFGHGVYVITSPEHLRNVSTNVKQKGYAYTLEEALTGMGLSEVGTYGAAYKGELLSLRCVIRTFAASQTVHTGDPELKNKQKIPQRNITSDVFVRGFMMTSGEQAFLPCSTEIVDVTRKMMAKTSYTGAFCSSLKSDKLSRPKMLEINARFCGPMAVTDALFISTFVPLTVAHHLARVDTTKSVSADVGGAASAGDKEADSLQASPQQATWYSSSRVYSHIVEVEKEVLRTGSGKFHGKMKAVARFDPALRVSTIGYDKMDGFKAPHIFH